MPKTTLFYDAQGNRTEPERAARAEVVTTSEDGSVLSVRYFEARKRPTANDTSSFFATCERDDKGHCEGRGPSPKDRSPPTPQEAPDTPDTAPAEEQQRSLTLARAKIKSAPVPSAAAVEKARKELEEAKRGEGRAGGDSRGGSARDRRRQRQNLFKEFEAKDEHGDGRGYVVCPWTGLKMHWTDDPDENPEHYPLFERGKIFTKCQGGGYQLANLIPESFTANRSRNDKRLRKENSDGCK